jgi:hypothetical protein
MIIDTAINSFLLRWLGSGNGKLINIVHNLWGAIKRAFRRSEL